MWEWEKRGRWRLVNQQTVFSTATWIWSGVPLLGYISLLVREIQKVKEERDIWGQRRRLQWAATFTAFSSTEAYSQTTSFVFFSNVSLNLPLPSSTTSSSCLFSFRFQFHLLIVLLILTNYGVDCSHRFSIKGRVYPAIVPLENHKVTGRVTSSIYSYFFAYTIH